MIIPYHVFQHTSQDLLERKLNVSSIQSGSLDERKTILGYDNKTTHQYQSFYKESYYFTSKLLGFIRWYSSQVSQITLVTDKHNDNV